MERPPFLSIVTPTRGDFSEAWLRHLVAVEGDVVFLLVYHPQTAIRAVSDPRIRSMVSPYKGAFMQRYVGLLNAIGRYVLVLDDDDFLHPQVVQMACCYFERFPDSWVLRLKAKKINLNRRSELLADWPQAVDVETLETCQKRPPAENPDNYLLEIPIAPLSKRFDPRIALLPGFFRRTDDRAIHIENFNTKIWRRDLLQPALSKLSKTMRLWGVLTWIPNYGDDRLLGLFLQAELYEEGKIVGHWMPKQGEQVRLSAQDFKFHRPRYQIFADTLLVKAFPQYGYFWNLFFAKLYGVPRTVGKSLKWKLFGEPEVSKSC